MTDPRIAVISDVHGNADALAAVLAELDAAGIGRLLNLGDHFSGPLDAAGTWALLRDRPMLSILGNHDRALIDRPPEAMGDWDRPAYAQLPPEALDWLRGLPATAETGDLLLCHGTPASDSDYWLERVAGDTLVLRDPAGIEAEVGGRPQALFLCGHSHVARLVRLADGRAVVNPGSVGSPAWLDDRPPAHRMETGSPDARYAVLEPGRPAGRSASAPWPMIPRG